MQTSAEIFGNDTLSNIVRRCVPDVSPDLLRVELNGDEIPRENWRLVRPRPGTLIEVKTAMAGGDDNSLLMTIASIAITAAGLFVTGGGLSPFLGAAFEAGKFGAQAAGALVTIGGQLAARALFPPARQKTGVSKEDEEYAAASAGSNKIEPGGNLPYVTYERDIAPPMVMYPRRFLKDGFDYVQAIVALAGPHALSNLRIGGASVDGAEDIRYKMHEGFDETFTGPVIVRKYGVPVSLNQPVSRFKCVQNSTTLTDQVDWERAQPQWHRFITTAGADEIRIRVQIGYFGKSDDATKTVRCPLRMRIRARGETAWRNLPEFHLIGRQTTPLPREIVLTFAGYPEHTTPVTDYTTFREAFRHAVKTSESVPEPIAGTYDWECDSAFSTGSGIADYDNVAFTRDAVFFHLDGTFDQAKAYEIELLQGAAVDDDDFTASTYEWDGDVVPLFTPYVNASSELLRTATDPTDYICDLRLEFVDSVFDEPPVAFAGDAFIEVEGRGRSIDQISATASAYVPAFSGGAWQPFSMANATTSPYPADHYYNMLSNERLAINTLSAVSIDTDTLADWRSECVTQGFRINAIIQSSVDDALSTVAQNGFARRKFGPKWGVIYERDRSSDSPAQIFSSRNARNLKASRPLARRPRGFSIRFLDAEQNDRKRQIIVDNPYGPDVGGYEEMSYPGLVTEAAIRRRALFDFEQIERRGVEYTIDVGAESIGCEAGQIVGLCWENLVETHRYSVVSDVSGDRLTLTLETEETFVDNDGVFAQAGMFAVPAMFRLGKQTAVSLVTPTGVETITVSSISGNEVTLSTAVSSADILGQPCAVGLSETTYRDMILTEIRRKPDHMSTLTLVDAAPEVAQKIAA